MILVVRNAGRLFGLKSKKTMLANTHRRQKRWLTKRFAMWMMFLSAMMKSKWRRLYTSSPKTSTMLATISSHITNS